MKWSKYNFLFKSKNNGFLLYNALSNSFIDIHDDDALKYEALKKNDDIKPCEVLDISEYEELCQLKILVKNDDYSTPHFQTTISPKDVRLFNE